MIKLMDRLMIRGYFKAYFVCLTSLLSLYVVVDLFTNLDDFVKKGQNLVGVFLHIFTYYSFQLTRIFDRLSEVIVLLAGMFTVAWMQRNNEQLPLLSAGVSTRRIVMPVLFCAAFMLSLTVLNQELLIPLISERLNYDKDDPTGEKEQGVKGQFEPNMIHIVGERAYRKDHMIRKFEVTIPEAVAGHPYHITAAEAYFSRIEPRGPNDKYKYKWELIGCHSIPGEIDTTWNPDMFQVKDVGRYVLYTREVDFEALTRECAVVSPGVDAPALSRIAKARLYESQPHRRHVPDATDPSFARPAARLHGCVHDFGRSEP